MEFILEFNTVWPMCGILASQKYCSGSFVRSCTSVEHQQIMVVKLYKITTNKSKYLKKTSLQIKYCLQMYSLGDQCQLAFNY